MLCIILRFVMEQHLEERDPLRQRASEGLAVRVLGPEGSVGCDGVVGHVKRASLHTSTHGRSRGQCHPPNLS